jgi:DHA1 family tetracycline resistance protein-like MFS transporter
MLLATKTKVLVYLALLLDVISIGIYIPAIEKLIDRYAVSPSRISLWLSVYALCAFFSTPLLGQLSDKYGRKRLLVACVFGTALSYFMIIGHHIYWIFILSRVINGITWGNFSILQAILSDISVDDIDRKKNLWFLGAIFGLGFIIGPVLGSLILGRADVETLFMFGALLSSVDALLLIVWLRETNKHPQQHAKIDLAVLRTIRFYFQKPALAPYLRSVLILWIGVFSYQSVLPIEVRQDFGIGGEYFGYILAMVGVVTACNMTILLPKFRLRRFSTRSLIAIAHIWLFVVMCWLTINNMLPQDSLRIFLILFMTAALFSSVYGPVYQWEMLAHNEPGKTGELTWVFASVQTLTMVIWPLLGGIILDTHLPLFIAWVVCVLISGSIMRRERKHII